MKSSKKKRNNRKKKIIVSIFLILVILGVSMFVHSVTDKKVEMSLNGDDYVEIELNSEYEEKGANAKIEDEDMSDKIVIDGQIDTSKIGEYEIKYSFMEGNKNKGTIIRKVKVVEHTSPEITLNGLGNIQVKLGDEYEEKGAKAIDNYDGDITDKIEITGSVDTSTLGEYEIKYKVSDSSGNTSEVTRKVNVVEEIAINTKGLPVLMYHFFYDESAGEEGKDNNFMEISSFENQMKYLSENNYYFPTWDEVVDYIDGKIDLPEKSIVITVDDGDNSFFRLAVPVINKYNVKATSFIVTTWTGKDTVDEYKSDKIDFQSHSNDMHSAGVNGKGKFVNYSYEQGVEDVEASAQVTGTKDAFCYPFGHFNDTAKNVLKDTGYKLAFTTQGGRVKPGQDKYQLPRVRMSKGISLNSFINSVS